MPKILLQNAEPVASVDDALRRGNAVIEPKVDGIRIVAVIEENGVRTFTRTGNEQTGKLQAIESDLQIMFPVGSTVDGEVVSFVSVDGQPAQDWGKAQSVLGSGVERAKRMSDRLSFVVFDLLTFDGLDIRSLPLWKRREALEGVVGGGSRVSLVPQFEASEEVHEGFLAAGFEGSMIKLKDAPYASGKRGHGWMKLKSTNSIDAIVTGFQDGQNGFSGMVGAVIFSQWKDGKLVERGKASGMDLRLRKSMTDSPKQFLGKAIEIEYNKIMESGALRHPRFVRVRPDKPVDECVWSNDG